MSPSSVSPTQDYTHPKEHITTGYDSYLGSNYELRSNTGIKGHKNLGYDKKLSTLR